MHVNGLHKRVLLDNRLITTNVTCSQIASTKSLIRSVLILTPSKLPEVDPAIGYVEW
jgi:hypothetical protein